MKPTKRAISIRSLWVGVAKLLTTISRNLESNSRLNRDYDHVTSEVWNES